MPHSPTTVRAVAALIAAAAALTLSACEHPGATETSAPVTASTSPASAPVQAPNAPASELVRTGWHCFDSPAAAAAAQARAQLAVDRENAEIKAEADRSGGLLPYGWPSKVGDLNGTLCYQVSDSGIR